MEEKLSKNYKGILINSVVVAMGTSYVLIGGAVSTAVFFSSSSEAYDSLRTIGAISLSSSIIGLVALGYGFYNLNRHYRLEDKLG